MSADASVDGRRARACFLAAVVAGLIGVFGAAWPKTVAAQQSGPVPDFSIDGELAWLVMSDDFLPPPSGPGPVTFEVRISVDDPGAFTTRWSAMQRFRRVPHEWSEDICAENNFDFLQYEVAPLPQAAKPDF